jgi:uncharacterized repeat protein (TIGR02543 family)
VADRLPIRRGYDFAGWVDAEGGDPFPVTITGDESQLVYAQWTPKQYTVRFDTLGGDEIGDMTVAYGDAIPWPAAEDAHKAHYVLSGWDPQPETMPAYNLTVKAVWTPRQYTVTFDADGGSAVAPVTDIYGAKVARPADPVREGYAFAGWDQAVPAYMPDTNPTIKARWMIVPPTPEIPEIASKSTTSFSVRPARFRRRPTANRHGSTPKARPCFTTVLPASRSNRRSWSVSFTCSSSTTLSPTRSTRVR